MKKGLVTASAQQHPINNSGIQAEILFLDTGSDVNGLVLSGRATGLDPTQTYFSLLYNTGSVAGGPSACTPSSSGPAITSAQMFTAFGLWLQTVPARCSGKRPEQPTYH